MQRAPGADAYHPLSILSNPQTKVDVLKTERVRFIEASNLPEQLPSDHQARSGHSLKLLYGTTRLEEPSAIQMVRAYIIRAKYNAAVLHPPVRKIQPRSGHSNAVRATMLQHQGKRRPVEKHVVVEKKQLFRRALLRGPVAGCRKTGLNIKPQ